MKMLIKSLFIPLIAMVLATVSFPGTSAVSFLSNLVPPAQARAIDPPAESRIDVGFSPNGGAEDLVLKVINSARQDIRLLGYSFTSTNVTRALIEAKRRGVDVRVAVDAKQNLQDDRSGKGRHALAALVNAGILVRVVSAFQIMHDKTIVVDDLHTETGSFNFSGSAASRNSENVLVVWNNPALAATYRRHWESRFALGVPYQAGY